MKDRPVQIIDAATRLIIEQGVGVSTAAIAAVAGGSNGTLFNYFATKQALIDAVYCNAKIGMFGAMTYGGAGLDRFDRASLHQNWNDYLHWARSNPDERIVMHILLESGLVSQQAREQVAKVAEPYGMWIGEALAQGVISGPNAAYVNQLIFFQVDLCVTQNLDPVDADLAFDMLCQALALNE